MNCPRCQVPLIDTYTPKGVVVDYCPTCQGIWFDRGELNYFSRSPEELARTLKNGLISPHESAASCPRCSVQMVEGGLIRPELLVDWCDSCQGIWLDAKELTQLQVAELSMKNLDPGKFFNRNYTAGTALEELTGEKISGSGGFKQKIAMPALPDLVFKSIGTFVVLYGILGVVMIVMAEAGLMSRFAAMISTLIMIAFNFAVSPFIMDFFLRFLQRLTWLNQNELPEKLREFISGICAKEKINFPSVGVIDDGTPNAFTYGHTPNNARIVVTRGLLEKLNTEEVNAVVGHELGHAVHWDILIMTMASMVPIILYYVARTLMEMKSSGSDNKNPGPLIGLVAYILYVISEYIVLFLSRTREYWADRYAAEATGNPNALSRALIKIAYGLAAADSTAAAGANANAPDSSRSSNRTMKTLATLGIFDPVSAKGLVATSARTGANGLTADSDTEISKENIVGAMQWDLWNPWAIYYELHSTHPLPAHRIEALSKTALAMDQTPYIVFNRAKPESYWDDFLVDFAVSYLPLVGIIAGVAVAAAMPKLAGMPLILFGAGYLFMLFFSYPKDFFPDHSIASLLKYVKVSGVRPVPATIKGRIIGKGIPGLVYSEDLTMQDATGYIFLDYEQPLAIFNFFFGLRNDAYIGSEVRAVGWYRRAPVPYFELYKLETYDGDKYCYAPFFKKLFAVAAIAVGIYLCVAL